MSFTGTEDHHIDLAQAAAMTKKYRDNNINLPLGGFFGKDAILSILNQENCVGIRFYNAENDLGEPTIILVGVQANQDDLSNGVLADFSKPSPPFNSSNNPLNS